jgi:hypothetical protein
VSITPPRPHDALIAVASRLSRAAPNQWDEFMKAFEAYSASCRDDCVQAAADKVLLAQGRARHCVELSKYFAEAIKQK